MHHKTVDMILLYLYVCVCYIVFTLESRGTRGGHLAQTGSSDQLFCPEFAECAQSDSQVYRERPAPCAIVSNYTLETFSESLSGVFV